jgi:hypothetical protein
MRTDNDAITSDDTSRVMSRSIMGNGVIADCHPPTSRLWASVTLVLPTVGNCNVWVWASLQSIISIPNFMKILPAVLKIFCAQTAILIGAPQEFFERAKEWQNIYLIITYAWNIFFLIYFVHILTICTLFSLEHGCMTPITRLKGVIRTAIHTYVVWKFWILNVPTWNNNDISRKRYHHCHPHKRSNRLQAMWKHKTVRQQKIYSLTLPYLSSY